MPRKLIIDISVIGDPGVPKAIQTEKQPTEIGTISHQLYIIGMPTAAKECFQRCEERKGASEILKTLLELHLHIESSIHGKSSKAEQATAKPKGHHSISIEDGRRKSHPKSTFLGTHKKGALGAPLELGGLHPLHAVK
jgi:hypothetical protein